MKEEITYTYIAFDGRKFNSKKEALEHEKKLNDIHNKEIHKKKYMVNDMMISHDDIVEFFSKMNCSSCPFKNECDKMRNRIRRSTTDTFNLCYVIRDNF